MNPENLDPDLLKEQVVNLADLRVRYSRAELTEDVVLPDPLAQFELWLREALDAKVPEPNAMTLSTVSAEGWPSGRIVLLKALREGQFVFYTNYASLKAVELEANPRAALTWHWHELERQVRVVGTVERVGAAETEAYFHSRPRESQIGAWASQQSQPVSRAELHARYDELAQRWEGQEIPVPQHWGGYALTPLTVEFWQGRPSRLHDRIGFSRTSAAGGWGIQRLSP
jgi:pyridoxamine 5'-phosphate oxidase